TKTRSPRADAHTPRKRPDVAKRTLGSLVRADLGAHVTFKSTQHHHVSGKLRAFSHGVYSSPARGLVDAELVMVTVEKGDTTQGALPSLTETHWGEPGTKAEVVRRG